MVRSRLWEERAREKESSVIFPVMVCRDVPLRSFLPRLWIAREHCERSMLSLEYVYFLDPFGRGWDPWRRWLNLEYKNTILSWSNRSLARIRANKSFLFCQKLQCRSRLINTIREYIRIRIHAYVKNYQYASAYLWFFVSQFPPSIFSLSFFFSFFFYLVSTFCQSHACVHILECVT